MPSPIRSTVDFTRPGKQFGHLYVPYSYNLGGWANLMLPIAVVRSRRGADGARPGRQSWRRIPGPGRDHAAARVN